MPWFLLSLLAATLQTSSILVDEHLLSRQFNVLSTLSLTATGAFAGVPLFLAFWVVADGLPSGRTFAGGFVAGWLLLLAFNLYYKALRRADAALVATLFQVVIVFNLLFGVLLFDERPHFLQYVGLAAISVAAILISLEQKEDKWRPRPEVFWYMVLASLLISLSDVAFKVSADTADFLPLALAEYASTIAAGVVILGCSAKVRTELWGIRTQLLGAFGMFQINEFFTLTSTVAIRYALVVGPLALIQGVMGVQPFIALLLTFCLNVAGLRPDGGNDRFKMGATRLALMFLALVGSILISGAFEIE